MAVVKVTEQEIQRAVDAELKTDNWQIDRVQDDRGLQPDEYFSFARAVMRRLGTVAT